mgnify:FL=1
MPVLEDLTGHVVFGSLMLIVALVMASALVCSVGWGLYILFLGVKVVLR